MVNSEPQNGGKRRAAAGLARHIAAVQARVAQWATGGLPPQAEATALVELAAELGQLQREVEAMAAQSEAAQRAAEERTAELHARLAQLEAELAVLGAASERLREREERYRAIGESIPFGVFVADARGRMLYLSASFLQLVGLPMEACRGEGWLRCLLPGDSARTRAEWQRTVQTGSRWKHEYRVVSADGQVYTVLSQGLPVRDRTGQIENWVGLNLDISDRKAMEEELWRLGQAAEQAARRTHRLQVVTAALSQAVAPEQVAQVIVQHAVGTLGSAAGVVLLLAEDGATLQVVAAQGYSGALAQQFPRLRVSDPLPSAEAVRTGQALWFASREAVVQHYPHVRAVMEQAGFHASAAVPLVLEGRAVGVLSLNFPEPRMFREEDRNFLLALAGLCAQALERARLYEVERQAHAALEAHVQARTAELQAANERLAAEIAERRRVEQRLERAREEERTRLAREVHDELGSAMTGIKMDLTWLQRHEHAPPEARQQKYEAVFALVDSTIDTIRRVATALRPSVLDDLGLLPALEWQFQEFQARTGLDGQFKAEVEEIPLPREPATALFRIFQEALTNVTRHAQATRVEVHITREAGEAAAGEAAAGEAPSAGWLRLEVRDNGVGISPATVAGMKSLGLLGMRERVHQLGGELEIEGRPGEGTTVRVRVPV